MNLDGKRVVLTGGAGGLGSAIARRLSLAGARVWLLDLDETRGKALAAEISADCPDDRIRFTRCDLQVRSEIDAVLDGVQATWEGTDVLINNAAIYPSKAFTDYTIDEYRQVHQVNVEAAVVASRRVVAHMRAASWGRIINISSITFFGGFANLAPYVMSKGSLIGLTRALATELGPDGITVNAISPGAFPTAAEGIHPDPEQYARFVIDQQAIKRRGTPADVANLVGFLVSDESGFITGQNINCDGGWFMR